MDVLINQNRKIAIDSFSKNEIVVDGISKSFDILKIDDTHFHLVVDNKSYNLEILKNNDRKSTAVYKINDVEMQVHVKDALETLLESMGMSVNSGSKVSELKAPMPGLVLRILAEAGQEVKKDDPLLVLEAMKMENLIKSPTDGIIDSILVGAGDKVDKNQVMLKFQ